MKPQAHSSSLRAPLKLYTRAPLPQTAPQMLLVALEGPELHLPPPQPV